MGNLGRRRSRLARVNLKAGRVFGWLWYSRRSKRVSKGRSKSQTRVKRSKSPPLPDTSDFMKRNQKWMEDKDKKFKKMKQKVEKQEMKECTFKPNTQGKDFLKKKTTQKLKSKISRSLSPHKIQISDHFDLSVMKQARLRIERPEDAKNNLNDQVSPKYYPPSAKTKKKGKDSHIEGKNNI